MSSGQRKMRCQECAVAPTGSWRGWRACRTDEQGTDDPPAVALYCPACADREFGAAPAEPGWRPLSDCS
jgi:hypothetical protein